MKGPRCAPVSATAALLSQPELGAARKIQAMAPRNDGVTNAAKTSDRISSRPGMSVRLTAHARRVPTTTAETATTDASTSELRTGSR